MYYKTTKRLIFGVLITAVVAVIVLTGFTSITMAAPKMTYGLSIEPIDSQSEPLVSVSEPIDISTDEPETDEPTMTYLGSYYITGYDVCVRCCGKTDGITASGTTATTGKTIATGNEFGFGTVLYIDGIGERTVEDRGVKNGCIDVLCDNHLDCYALTGWYDVYLIEGD